MCCQRLYLKPIKEDCFKILRDLNKTIFSRIEALLPLLPLLARGVFATSLLIYFWTAGVTKLGPGVFGFLSPAPGAYIQILPRAMELINCDPEIGRASCRAEFVLPALIVLGLVTRVAALGMIGFITIQSLTDLYGHGGITQPATLGAWFDKLPDGLILDQRAFWIFTLLVLVLKGGGILSLDRIFGYK